MALYRLHLPIGADKLLPVRRFPNIHSRDRVRQLRVPQAIGPDAACKVGMSQKLARWPPVPRRYQADSFPTMLFHEAHRLRQVAVVAHYDGAVVEVQPPVVQEMHGEISRPSPFPQS